MSELWILIGLIVSMLTLGVVFFGAPYVPTRARDLDKLFDVAQMKRGDMLIDLGSGDGRLMLGAAARGFRSVGVELNPILVVLSWFRLRRFRQVANVRYGNFWSYKLPSDTTHVFVFLADPFMQKLKTYLESEAKRLGRPLTLISYGFSLPDYKPVRTRDAVMVFKIKG